MKFETIFATTKADALRKLLDYKKSIDCKTFKLISTSPKKIKKQWCIDVAIIEKDNGFFNELSEELL